MQHIDRLNVIKALVLLEDEQIVRFNIAANDNASQIHMLVDGLGVGLTHEPVAAGMISHRQLVTVLGNMTTCAFLFLLSIRLPSCLMSG